MSREKVVRLPIYDIIVTADDDGENAVITSNLKERCRYCNKTDCYFQCEDAREETVEIQNENMEVGREMRAYNCAMGAIEAMILAHACAGTYINTVAYRMGIKAAVKVVVDNFPFFRENKT